MIARLIFQDPALRRMPVWVAIGLVQVGVAAGFLFWALSSGRTVSETVVAALIWFPVALFLVFGEIGTRASRFHLALPLSTRQLWLSHLIAVGLTGVAVLAVAATFTTSALVLQRKLVGGELIGTGTMVAGGGLLVAGLILAVVVLQAYRPYAQEVPMSPARVGWSLLVAVGSCAAALALWPLGIAGALILVATAAISFVPIYRRLPVALSIPARAGRPAAEDAMPETVGDWKAVTPGGGLWMALRTVHGVSTCAKKSFVIWLILPFLMFLGFLMAIDLRPGSDRFAYPFMIVYVIMVVTGLSVSRLGAIDWLPWSRRRTFALLTMPFLLATAIGYVAGSAAHSLGLRVFDRGEPLCMSKDRRSGDYTLCVLPSASRISWDGAPPEITTPWGESHEPWNRPVLRGLPARAWYPYSVPAGSSPEFAALQISGLVEDRFGVHIAPDEIEARYLRAADDGSVMPVDGGLTLAADYPDLHAVGGGVYFPWLMAGVVALWALLMAGCMAFLRSGVSERRRKLIAWVFIVIPLALWMGVMYLEAFGISSSLARNTFFIALSREAGATTIGTLATWLGSALVAWGAYRLAERRFERAELIPDRVDTCATD